MTLHAPLVIASTVASRYGFRTMGANGVRLALGLQALKWAHETSASFLLLPAGYLRASSETDVARVAAPLIKAAQEYGVAITMGIDACGPMAARKAGHSNMVVRRGTLPLFGVAFVPGEQVKTWRQRSTTRENGNMIPPNCVVETREILIQNRRFAVLLCGESFSQILRARLTAGTPPDLLAVPAHEAAGMRHHNAFAFFASHGTPMLRAVHAVNGAKNDLVGAGNSIGAVVAEKTHRQGKAWLHVRAFNI
jgi:hypothetical protein